MKNWRFYNSIFSSKKWALQILQNERSHMDSDFHLSTMEVGCPSEAVKMWYSNVQE